MPPAPDQTEPTRTEQTLALPDKAGTTPETTKKPTIK